MLEKQSSALLLIAIGRIFQSCYIDLFKLLHRFVKVVLCNFFLCQTEEVGIKIYVGKAIKRPPSDRAIGPCLTELDKWEHLAPQNEQSRYEKKMILANTDNWNHMIREAFKNYLEDFFR